MPIKINTPILIIGFNRPDIIKQTFEYIRKAKPKKLYIAIDGPRPEKEGEEKLVEQVKQVVENVDWSCEKHYKYNESNKGAEVTVSSAISWVFETEEYVIILEDDIVAPMAFLKFAQEMLELYKNEDKIWAVSGINFTPLPTTDGTDYFFAKYGHTGGGWATWKRVWDKFDLYTEVQDNHLKTNFLKTITNSGKELKYYRKKFKRIKKNGVGKSTWDNIASYMHRTNNLLYIIPRVNLVSNIGVNGLHARGRTQYHFVEYDKNFTIKNHPKDVTCNIDYDKNHFDVYINRKSHY
ncbi:hypothetical protein SAMN05444280_14422 [Tangfeifania diversioriginum]|uniref:Glycosyl transferase family 2 n=1 Tax=Tangfeifania diversioriginum TaxID=1168035 RepID=A0A1M6NP10_9BACT|nr:hypothetical protein [Tangfeifania diversioriginum]SHJ97398.1 hypothetical protein SAMN05444280_14422 [Tangfeifania diversioriginum]